MTSADFKMDAEDSKAMNEFRDIITADRTSHRSSYITGRLHSSQNSRYALEPSMQAFQETDTDLLAWKLYCIEAARKFKSEGNITYSPKRILLFSARESLPILEQRKHNPSSLRWSNTLHMMEPPSAYDGDIKPSSYLVAYQERYKIAARAALHQPKLTIGKTLGLKID